MRVVYACARARVIFCYRLEHQALLVKDACNSPATDCELKACRMFADVSNWRANIQSRFKRAV